MYQLKQGSIFDQKCDVVIIPCNNYGGIAHSVENDLVAYGLPTSIKISVPGQVTFEICPKHFTLSSVIGYSASVSLLHTKRQSAHDLLHSICEQIMEYCQNNSLRFINMPLLGTGSGRLSYQESFQIIKEHFSSEQYMKANIFALSENIYHMLRKSEPQSETNNEFHPRVFISYTNYDDDNRKWVKELCIKLRKNGVDARCDIFHLKLGQDLPQWMTNEISLANKVLLICDKYYFSKTNPRRGGVGWETMLVQGDMLMNPDINKYICIMREKNPAISLPTYMRTKYSLTCNNDEMNDEQFKLLLRSIFDCEEKPIPLGSIPQFIKDMIIN